MSLTFSAPPERLDFFQAVRRIEAATGAALGRSRRPGEDPVRLGQAPGLFFAPSTVASFSAPRGGTARLEQYFFGLFGPNGPLPTHLTLHAYARARNAGDDTFSRFADLFHHRLLSFFYRAWAQARPTVTFDHPEDDRFARMVSSVAGVGLASLAGRDALGSHDKLYFAARLAGGGRGPDGLAAMVMALLRLPARVAEFVGAWMRIPRPDQWRLGADPRIGALGQSATLGAAVWGCHQKFRLVLGPLGLEEFQALLPGRRLLARLVALVRSYAGDTLDWDLRLDLKAGEVPQLRLDGSRELGWTTWLGSRRTDAGPATNLVLEPRRYSDGRLRVSGTAVETTERN